MLYTCACTWYDNYKLQVPGTQNLVPGTSICISLSSIDEHASLNWRFVIGKSSQDTQISESCFYQRSGFCTLLQHAVVVLVKYWWNCSIHLKIRKLLCLKLSFDSMFLIAWWLGQTLILRKIFFIKSWQLYDF